MTVSIVAMSRESCSGVKMIFMSSRTGTTLAPDIAGKLFRLLRLEPFQHIIDPSIIAKRVAVPFARTQSLLPSPHPEKTVVSVVLGHTCLPFISASADRSIWR